MKLADIEDSKVPQALLKYACKYGYESVEIKGKASEFSDVTKLINNLLKYAKEKKCEEFCFHEIRSDYNIKEDLHSWHVILIGFRKVIKKY